MEKISIIICDDDRAAAESLAGQLQALCPQYQVDPEIQLFTDGLQLTENWPKAVDLVFLDVEMPLMDGISAGREIRRWDEQVTILFTTSHASYAVNGYEVNAYRYLLKPITTDALQKALERKLPQLVAEKGSRIYIRLDEGVKCLNPGEILFVETAQNHRVSVHLKSETISAYKNLNEFEARLTDGRFFKCHASFLINLDHIVRFDKNAIEMSDGCVIPVSKHRKKALMDAMLSRAGKLF